ncbi:MAG: sterol desaturase family protein [Flavobacteriales bacterium]
MNILIFVCSFLLMELVAWSAHKYIMHGFLWRLHKDHHTKENSDQVMEHNDFFFVIFATPGIICIVLGSFFDVPYTLAIGSGISVYGLCYFLVHDIFIHQRIKLFSKSNNAYFRAIRRAHKKHHKHLTKEHGECFGMLLVPFKYFRNELAKK